MIRRLAVAILFVFGLASGWAAGWLNVSQVHAANVCGSREFWINDLAYGTPGGGVYWDPLSSQVWTASRSWHYFAPEPPRPNPMPLWVNQLDYGSRGGGFYWDPVSGQVWTAERGWHMHSAYGCGAATVRSLALESVRGPDMGNEYVLGFRYDLQATTGGDWYLFVEAVGRCRDANGVKLGRSDGIGGGLTNFTPSPANRLSRERPTLAIEAHGHLFARDPQHPPALPATCSQTTVGIGYFSSVGPLDRPSPETAEVYVRYVLDAVTTWTYSVFEPCPTCSGDW